MDTAIARSSGPRVHRGRIACDSCHDAKIKCDSSVPSCANCARRHVACTYVRPPKKRGKPSHRKDDRQSPNEALGSTPPAAKLVAVYPVLAELADLPFSMEQASRLLERLFDEPTLDLGCRYMLRRSSVLHMENPRKTSPALLYAMLCVALYLEPPMLMHKGDCNSYRRHLFQVALNAIPSDLLPSSPTVDIVITYLMLMNVCTCEYALHLYIPRWLDNAVFYARQLHLSAEKDDEKDEEKKEERRRYYYS
jgi:hypothetical protein